MGSQRGYRHFFTGANAALHADYRYFDDDWGVGSHTLDLAWYQNVGALTQVIPFLRYYTQGEADFFYQSGLCRPALFLTGLSTVLVWWDQCRLEAAPPDW